jgi:PAS domain S-box-containing protein
MRSNVGAREEAQPAMESAGPLVIALFMTAAAFGAIALTHLLIWARRPVSRVHLFFALTTLAAGADAIAEAWVYTRTTADAMGPAYKAYVSISGVWILLFLWFVAEYTRAQSARRWIVNGISAVIGISFVAHFLSPLGLPYLSLSGLRDIALPWGEHIALPIGDTNPWRLPFDLATLGLIAFVVDGAVRVGREGRRSAALVLGLASVWFVLLFSGHALLVDVGVLDSPYLSIFGFLAVASVMSFELAGEVVNASVLSEEVRANERRWRTLLENVRLLVVGSNAAGDIDYVNPYFEATTGYPAPDVIGLPFADWVRPQSAANSNGEPWCEQILSTRAGAQRVVAWSVVTLRDRDDAEMGRLAIGANVTRQREAETARDQALHELRVLQQRLEEENLYLRQEVEEGQGFGDFVGEGDAMRYVQTKIAQVAPTGATVLIEGETGVGKELVARALHQSSARAGGPFIRVNCAALPVTLLESELFGHEKGAFTGAAQQRKGRFELADGGTLLLDEVGELPLEAQAKLLRVLQENEVERLGGSRPTKVDVRIIAATNRDLSAEIAAGRFREDLYYRLNVWPITVPPLRDRPEDIPLLVAHFARTISARLGKSVDEIPPAMMRELCAYHWPGNVRELENVIERAVITTPDQVLRLADPLVPANTGRSDLTATSRAGGPTATLENVERDHVLAVLEATSWRISGENGAAKILGLNPSTLRSRMKKLGLRLPH